MIIDRQRLQDGQLTFERGVDTGRSPSRIDRNQLAHLVNATCRDDSIQTRPGWTQLKLTFPANPAKPDYATVFKTGLFQRATGYRPRLSGEPHLILSIAGRIFRVNVASSLSVQEMTIPGENNPNLRRAWFEQAEEYLLWQDNQDTPLIYDGVTWTRSDVNGTSGFIDGVPLKELPVGNVMSYCNGRLTVALPDGRSFTVGDIVGGPSGAGSLGRRSAVYHFTENQFLNEVSAFSVPVGVGNITAMKPMANPDTSLGQGPLQVFTTDAGFSLNLPPDRTTWLNVTYPIQSVSLIKQGALSAEGVVTVNGDLWFRAKDGIRSFIVARRNFGMWAHAPMSHEVERYLNHDDRNLLAFNSAALFDNRLLTLTNPRYVAGHGVVFDGLVALDFTPITALGQVEPPAWEGLWTGIHCLQLVPLEINGVDHLYAVGIENDELCVWELSINQRYDVLSDGSHRRITVAFETPRFDFKNRLERKQLENCELWISDMAGTVDGVAYHRPDQDPVWHDWQTWQLCAPVETCEDEAVEGCQVALNKRPQWKPRLTLQAPPTACETGVNKFPTSLGYEHQIRFEITGSVRIESIRVSAKRIPEEIYGECESTEATCEPLTGCDPNDLALPEPIP